MKYLGSYFHFNFLMMKALKDFFVFFYVLGIQTPKDLAE